MSEVIKYALVAINAPFGDGTLTYSYESLSLSTGDLVQVPLGRRQERAVVLDAEISVETIDVKIISKLKSIDKKLDDEMSLSPHEMKLFRWISNYYHYPIGQLIFDVLPKILKRPRQFAVVKGEGNIALPQLTDQQQSIFQKMNNNLHSFQKYYLHGVTGSGKTLIYIRLMQEVLKQGKSVHFLLPEINLTPQFIKTFSDHLNVEIYSYHSAVTDSEKFLLWKKLKNETAPYLLMGVRSSIFLPTPNVGLVIVDEEHDQSFKQVDRCPYNARDIAIVKAQFSDIPVVLGSATPTVENFYAFTSSENHYFQLPERVTGYFPEIVTIDTREHSEENTHWPLHASAIDEMKQVLARKEQVLVFINKLGFANFIQCRSCGHQFQNEDCGCGLNLRYFKAKCLLSCSHCDFKMPAPESCPKCGNIQLLQKGFGTEKIHEVLSECFPQHVVARFDRDEIKNFDDLKERLDDFHARKIDILVGTQMLSKGHNFQHVNLVLILGVDSQLNFADFRSQERTYQLVAQVAGRAGRYSQKSRVLIQTMNPDNPVFKHLKGHDLSSFYREELEHRRNSETPPFKKQVMIYYSSRQREQMVKELLKTAENLKMIAHKHFSQVEVLGPIPSMIEKRAEHFTWFLLLKSDDTKSLHQLLSTFEKNFHASSNISVKIDVDPYHTC